MSLGSLRQQSTDCSSGSSSLHCHDSISGHSKPTRYLSKHGYQRLEQRRNPRQRRHYRERADGFSSPAHRLCTQMDFAGKVS
jgi:hypothetical protein